MVSPITVARPVCNPCGTRGLVSSLTGGISSCWSRGTRQEPGHHQLEPRVCAGRLLALVEHREEKIGLHLQTGIGHNVGLQAHITRCAGSDLPWDLLLEGLHKGCGVGRLG